MWLAECAAGTDLLWAILPVTSIGRTMLLIAPTSIADARQRQAGELLTETVLSEYAARDIHLAQVLLEPVGATILDFYKSLRFKMMAELIYLQASPKRSAPLPDLPEGFTWQTYDAAWQADFAATIAGSYVESLDCPSLNNLRSMDDVIAGHKAAGRFDPNHWFLLKKSNVPQGVLLLTQTPGTDAMELVYLGLVPQARGQDLGDLLMRQALAIARKQNCSRLTLAVDSLNAPALKLYYRHGMRRIGDKMALMRDLRVGFTNHPHTA